MTTTDLRFVLWIFTLLLLAMLVGVQIARAL